MPIQVTCPNCKAEFKVSEKFAGKQGPCPKCKATITVPKLEDEVKVHAPEDAPQGSIAAQTRQISKPIERQEIKFQWPVAAAVVLVTVLAFAAAYVGGDALNSKDESGQTTTAAYLFRGVALLLVGFPLAAGAYAVLRDSEQDPHRGMALAARAGICSVLYAVTWGAYLAVPADIGGSALTWVFITPVFFILGTVVAYFCFDLDALSSFFHYCAYIVVSLALGKTAGVPMPWSAFIKPAAAPSEPEGVKRITQLIEQLTNWM